VRTTVNEGDGDARKQGNSPRAWLWVLSASRAVPTVMRQMT
jgi:hypothetical protein